MSELSQKIDGSDEVMKKWFSSIAEEVKQYVPYMGLEHSGGICVDVGANVGAFPMCFYDLFDKFICVEPFSLNVKFIEQMKVEKNLSKLSVLQKAVTDKDGLDIVLRPYAGGEDGTSINYMGTLGNLSTQLYTDKRNNHGWKEENPGEVIQTISLDTIVLMCGGERINLLKVDCEGAEFDFLYGKDLTQVNSITMELHNFLGEEKQKLLIEWIEKTHRIYKCDNAYPDGHCDIGFIRKQ